jgi:hypothetical protein
MYIKFLQMVAVLRNCLVDKFSIPLRILGEQMNEFQGERVSLGLETYQSKRTRRLAIGHLSTNIVYARVRVSHSLGVISPQAIGKIGHRDLLAWLAGRHVCPF